MNKIKQKRNTLLALLICFLATSCNPLGQLVSAPTEFGAETEVFSIGDVSDQTFSEGNNSGDISFTISNSSSELDCSTDLSATSTNTTLLPVANITFAGTYPNCTVRFTSAANEFGTSSVTLTLSNGSSTVTDDVLITVTSVNNTPTISDISSQSTNRDTTSSAIAFTINDVDNTLNCSTSVTASSSNTSVVANSGVTFAGTAPNCTATVAPVASASGTITLTFTVSDGNTSANDSFSFQVIPTFSKTWDFSTAGDYVYDSNIFQFSSGEASPLSANIAHTSTNFSSGTLYQSEIASSKLTNVSTITNPGASVNTILPNRTSDQVAYYRMDNNWNDSSSNSYNGTAYGNATFTTSAKVNTHAGSFDGDGDYVNVPGLDPDNYSELTVSLWFKVNTSSYAGLIKWNENGSWGQTFLVLRNSGNLDYRFGSGSSATNYLNVSAGVKFGAWNHAVISHKATGENRLYVNGNLVHSATAAALVNNTDTLMIGHNAGTTFINGSMDEISIWSKQLTSAEIEQIYSRQALKYTGYLESPILDIGKNVGTASFSSVSWKTEMPFWKDLPGSAGSETSSDYSALVGSTGNTSDNDLMSDIHTLYHLDEASGTSGANSIIDSSGNGYHGSPTGTPVFGKIGVLGKSTYFAGSDFNISTSATLLSQSAFTISFWVNGAPQGDRKVYSERGTQSAWNIGTGSSGATYGKLRMYLRDDTNTTRLSKTTTNDVYDNRWHHVVITDNNGDVEVYVDGVKDATNFDYTRTAYTPVNIRVMSENGGGQFTGTIDEFATWTKVLTQAEVTQLYRRGVNRVKVQVRSCDDSSCSGETWLGPNNGDDSYYFSEQTNCSNLLTSGSCDYSGSGSTKSSAPSMSFADFSNITVSNNRYFQYKIILESIDELASPTFPTVTSFNIGAKNTYSGAPSIVTNTGESFSSLSSFSATTGGTCSPTYQLSLDKSTWYYHNGTSWVSAASGANSNSKTVVNSNISTFSSNVGTGTVYIKVIPNAADSTVSCTVSDISINGVR